jgi:hypothetical protein
MPALRRVHSQDAPERGLRAIEAARKVLAVQAAAGNDPRASDRIGRKRGYAKRRLVRKTAIVTNAPDGGA